MIQRKNNKWQALYFKNGKRIYIGTYKTKAEALRMVRINKEDIRQVAIKEKQPTNTKIIPIALRTQSSPRMIEVRTAPVFSVTKPTFMQRIKNAFTFTRSSASTKKQ